jgi:hypothetical protein
VSEAIPEQPPHLSLRACSSSAYAASCSHPAISVAAFLHLFVELTPIESVTTALTLHGGHMLARRSGNVPSNGGDPFLDEISGNTAYLVYNFNAKEYAVSGRYREM